MDSTETNRLNTIARAVTPPAQQPRSLVAVSADRVPKTDVSDEQARRQMVEAFIAKRRKQILTVETTEHELRKAQKEDAKFDDGDQWDPVAKAERLSLNKPILTIPRLGAFKRQVLNEMRQARPSVQVVPKDGVATPEVAQAFQGVIRDIEDQSHAEIAYDTGCDHQLTIGRGYVMGAFEFEQDSGFDQVIRLRRVRDPNTIYIDPATNDFVYEDARYGYEKLRIPKDDFLDEYGQVAYDQLLSVFTKGFDNDWMPEGDVTVCQGYYVERVKTMRGLVQMAAGPDGATPAPIEMLLTDEVEAELWKQGAVVQKRRQVMHRQVYWVLFSGADILEGNEDKTAGRPVPGSRVPIFPIIGEERHRDGKTDYRGIIRDPKDCQRMYNIVITNEAETLAMQPRQPFIAAEGQLEGHEIEWRNLNQSNRSVLLYKPKTLDGQLLPPPQRQSPSVDLSAFSVLIRQHDNDLKSVIGLFDASLGQRGPEQSGRAVLARQRQGQIGTSHYGDNLSRTVEAVGDWYLETIPYIYDTPRVCHIVGLDEVRKKVLIHAGNVEQTPEGKPVTDEELQRLYGVKEVFNLGSGRYGAKAQMGPSHTSRRADGLEALLAFVQAYPAAFPVIADIIAEFSDWPGAQRLVERFRKMNPNLQDAPGMEDIPPAIQAQMHQLMQALQQCQQALAEANETLRTKRVQAMSDELIAAMDNETKIAIASAERQSDEALTHVQHEFEVFRLALQHSLDAKLAAASPAPVAGAQTA